MNLATMTTTEAIPDRIPPMLASSRRPFDDQASLFELKWDGVRALTAITNDRIRIWGRDLQAYTLRYPELACLRDLPNGTVLDGDWRGTDLGRGEQPRQSLTSSSTCSTTPGGRSCGSR